MKHKPWTDEEKKYLKENYSNKMAKEIAKDLNRTYKGVVQRVHLLGLKKVKEWTNEEDIYLSENYSKLTIAKLADDLGRTESAIRNRASTLCLKKESTVYAVYEGDKFLAVGTVDELTKAVYRSEATVRRWLLKKNNQDNSRFYGEKIS